MATFATELIKGGATKPSTTSAIFEKFPPQVRVTPLYIAIFLIMIFLLFQLVLQALGIRLETKGKALEQKMAGRVQ